MEEIFELYNGISLNDFLVSRQSELDYDEQRDTADYYLSFLKATDYAVNKIMEAQLLGVPCKDYTEVLRAREYARNNVGGYIETWNQ